MSRSGFFRAQQERAAAAFAAIPEPEELTRQSEAMAAARERAAQPCANCGKPRSQHGFKASTADTDCRFVAACPNEGDPILCKYDPKYGYLVPEAGCPVHDKAGQP